MFQSGQRIGPYLLVSLIGRGGFGEVWLAERHTPLLTTKVAVKLPLDGQVDLGTVKQEAILWERASGHPNVLPIIEANIYDGQVVIVSEYAPSGSLADLLKGNKPLPVEKAIELTLGILSGLEYLHSRQIIHRDLKPANILIQGDTPRLADFGISRALKTTQTSQSVNIKGTPPFMAPEVFDGKRNVQTDIWSIGVILYSLLSGHLPFPQQDVTSLIGAIVDVS
jgi:serine/threonine-protein kinase